MTDPAVPPEEPDEAAAAPPAAPASPTVRPGLFLALDGPDGGGKSTQVAGLVEWLRDQGLPVVACRDPGGTALGERLRAILLDRDEVDPGLRAEMLLYMASRAQLVDQVIRPALEAGSIVISDRYLLANVVYQGHAGGLPPDEVWRVGRVATGGLMPDLLFLLDVPPEVADARIGAPRDRMEERGAEFRRKVRSGFLRALKNYPAPFLLVDASGSPERVAAKLQREVARVLAWRARS